MPHGYYFQSSTLLARKIEVVRPAGDRRAFFYSFKNFTWVVVRVQSYSEFSGLSLSSFFFLSLPLIEHRRRKGMPLCWKAPSAE